MKLSVKRNLDLIVGEPLIFIFRYLAKSLGFILRRDHCGAPKGNISVLKMAGGGSLVIAYPSLLSIKRSSPNHEFNIVCTPSVAPFAKSLGIFDKIIILNDNNPLSFLVSLVRFIRRYIFRYDTIINLEVHSRLTTIISLMTCARNRVGFYRHDFKKFANLNTHSLFFNLTQKIPDIYDAIVGTLKANKVELENSRTTFIEYIKTYRLNENSPNERKCIGTYDIGVSAVCSDLALERMMPFDIWKLQLDKKIDEVLSQNKKVRIFLYGAPSDKNFYDDFSKFVFSKYTHSKNVKVINFAGAKPLGNTINHFQQIVDEFYGVDTSLIHYARLLGLKNNSFWGPTSPDNYLRDFNGLTESRHYLQVPCSPCVHFVRNPPCNGKNICMLHRSC